MLGFVASMVHLFSNVFGTIIFPSILSLRETLLERPITLGSPGLPNDIARLHFTTPDRPSQRGNISFTPCVKFGRLGRLSFPLDQANEPFLLFLIIITMFNQDQCFYHAFAVISKETYNLFLEVFWKLLHTIEALEFLCICTYLVNLYTS